MSPGFRARLATALAAAWLLVASAPGQAAPPGAAASLRASALSTDAPAPARAPWPPLLGEVLADAIDDPVRLRAKLQARLDALGPDAQGAEAFWLHIAAARTDTVLEHDDAVEASLDAARRVLAASPAPTAEQRAWLEFTQLRLRVYTQSSLEAQRALAEARRRLGVAAHSVLGCEFDETESWVLRALRSFDEAWHVAESLEACAAATGWPHFRAQALADRAEVAGQSGHGRAAPERVALLYDEAYAAVGPGAGRFLRSLIAYSAGTTLNSMQRYDEAVQQLGRALAASRAIDDGAGIAAALIELAGIEVTRRRHADALRALDEAEPVLARLGTGTDSRLLALNAERLKSMAALGHPALAATLEDARALEPRGVTASQRANFERAAAVAEAALGRHAAAYESMRRAHLLAVESQDAAEAGQVQRLQALYDATRREAELAALRHGEEAARLSLQAEQAKARMLWAALAAALALGGGATVVGWRLWARRRELTELALRDTLTGLPNRRAIEAYARAQLAQARRLGLPFSLALIDLDHFKGVNDRHGHAGGDAVLRAFAQALPQVLRSPDRLGRWGGEEFLLVLPGTSAAELPGLFGRLRAAFAAVTIEGLPAPHGGSFSMGAVEAEPGLANLEALVAAADRRLYRAKDEGRDRLVGD